MSTFEKWSFNILAVLVTASGILYLWMKYFMSSADPFSVVNHPLQPLMLQIHILASPLFILVLGVILQSHITRKIKSGHRPNRRSGLLALATIAGMVLSGYLLQVVVNPFVSRAFLVTHLASGVLFAATYTIHLVVSGRLPVPSASRRGTDASVSSAA